ncbi:MAG: HlyD family secretion protein [Verrucomicrobia bacterium]|jgi:RND family efflux transporter MFP subunit|nr:HlyD family secretion protein [Verrucomicrobiota bacterium]
MEKFPAKYVVTGFVVVLAAMASLGMYERYTTKPWTRDAQVRANVVGIACRVSGPITNIPIRDNQTVKKGDLLFEIDPSTYIAATNNALAKLQQTEADVVQTKQELDRQEQLYKTKVNDLRDLQNAQDSYAAAQANRAAAKADLESAQLNLSYTKIFAPVDGYITNMNTSPGTYVYAGQQLLALVDSNSFWVAAYFKETQLHHVRQGGPVAVTFIGRDDEPFEGVVESVAWGIHDPDGSTNQDNLLPSVSQTVDWVRLPNRFPVRVLVTGQPPIPLRIGQTVSVATRGE